MDIFYIIQIIVSSLIALITIYLIALFIKSKIFQSYSCFNIMLMSIVLLIDCLLLAVPPFGKEGEYSVGKFVISIIKNFLDKMILSVLSLQVIIVYAGIIHTEFYFSHEKSFVKIGDAVCAIVSGALAIVFSSIRWVRRKDKNNIEKMIFDENDDNDYLQGDVMRYRNLARKILESIFCGVNLFINVFFLVVVISHISKKRREAKAGLIQDLGYGKQLLRFSLIFSVNFIVIIFEGVVVNFSDNFGISSYNKYCGIVFLVICFLIQLCFMINKTVYQETCKIFCKNKENKEDEIIKSVSTFEIVPSDDEEDN